MGHPVGAGRDRPEAGTGEPPWEALPVLMAGTFLIVLDFFIVNVAIPSIQKGLHAGPSAVEWLVAGYGLTFAVFLISAGRLGDRIGRRRAFSAGIGVFVAASTICGLSPDPAVLDLARLAQGAGAALISSNVLSIIGVLYTGTAWVRAITVYGMVMGLAATSGQLIGGLLIQTDVLGLGWRAIFLINLPVGVAGLALAPRLVPESRAPSARRLDPVGMTLVTLGLAALVLPLVDGRQMGWPAWTWVSLGAAPVLLGVLGAHQRRLAHRGGAPLLDPALFAIGPLRAGLVTQLAFWCAQASFFFVLALYLQDGRGLDPLRSGLVFSILALAYLAASLRAPRLTLRYGRDLVAVGALCVAGGDVCLAGAVGHLGSGGPVGWLAPGLVLVGAGQGLCITPLTATVLAHTDPDRAGAVSGVLSTMQQLGNALGVAITGVIFFGALPGGYAHAFRLSLVELASVLAGVAVLTRLLPSRRAPEASPAVTPPPPGPPDSTPALYRPSRAVGGYGSASPKPVASPFRDEGVRRLRGRDQRRLGP
jgi:MFS family permease